MRKKRTLKTSAILITKLTIFLKENGLLESFIDTIKEAYEFGFFIGICEGIYEHKFKNKEEK